MIKIRNPITRAINAVKRVRTKAKSNEAADAPKKVRTKKSWRSRKKDFTPIPLERSPERDVLIKESSEAKKVQKSKKDNSTKVGDFLIKRNMELAEEFKNDLEKIALSNPEITFSRSLNETSVKELISILEKIAKRSEQFKERGFTGVIRDGVRARIFMADPDKNYPKFIEEMKKKKYQIAKNFMEDAEGNIVLGKDGKPVMVDDIDVRFGEKARPSGYCDVQMRFVKKGALYEVIILPGPNYLDTANREHKLLYEQLRKYSILGLDKDVGAKQIIAAIEEEFYKLSRSWYADAQLKDKKGVSAAKEAVAFTPEGIKSLNELFKSLKNLYLGKFNSKPPSKRTSENFRDTKVFQSLNEIERDLKKVMDMFKPVTPAQS